MTEYTYIIGITKVKSSVPYHNIDLLEDSRQSFEMAMKNPMGLFAEEDLSVEIERIYPEAFVDRKGRVRNIGMPRKVQDELRLPIAAIESMKRDLEKQRWVNTKILRERTAFENKLEEFDTMTFWERFKFLWKS